MSEELRKRIGDAYLNPTFVDGQVLLHTQLNEIVSVAKEGINENYYDIQRLIKGEYSVGNSEKINGALLSRYLDTTLQEDDNLVPSSQQVKAYIDTEIEKVQKSFDVGDLILEVNDLKTKVSTNENSISAVEISIEELKQSDNLISGNIKGLEEGIVAVNNSISALSGSLSATQEQVITNENTIAELQEELSRQTSSLSSLSQNVNKLDSSVTAFGKDISTITENVSKLDEDVAEISETVNSFNTTINDINTNVSNLEEQVSNTVSELSNVKTDTQNLSSLIGNINNLTTTAKTNIVNAINEVKEIADNAGGGDLPIASTDVLGGIKVGETLEVAEDGTLNTLPSIIWINQNNITDYFEKEGSNYYLYIDEAPKRVVFMFDRALNYASSYLKGGKVYARPDREHTSKQASLTFNANAMCFWVDEYTESDTYYNNSINIISPGEPVSRVCYYFYLTSWQNRSGDVLIDRDTAQEIKGIKTFTELPKSTITPTDDAHLVNKAYVDAKIGAVNEILATLTTISEEE